MSEVVLDTLSALIVKARNSPALIGVSVVDGPRVSSESDTERLFIGVDIDPTNGFSAEGVNNPDTLPGVVDVETFTITCVSEKFSGGTDIPSLRVRVFEIRNAVRDLLRPDSPGRVLGVSGLAHAYIGSWSLYQSQTSKGAYVGLQFRIDCTTRPTV